jgi:hypothetical protein
MRAPELPADTRSAFSPIGSFLSQVVGAASGGIVGTSATSSGNGERDG